MGGDELRHTARRNHAGVRFVHFLFQTRDHALDQADVTKKNSRTQRIARIGAERVRGGAISMRGSLAVN